jgi:hypothetical protein
VTAVTGTESQLAFRPIGREGGTFSREFFTEPKAVVMQVSIPHRYIIAS